MSERRTLLGVMHERQRAARSGFTEPTPVGPIETKTRGESTSSAETRTRGEGPLPPKTENRGEAAIRRN